jgi:hypothetical protein
MNGHRDELHVAELLQHSSLSSVAVVSSTPDGRTGPFCRVLAPPQWHARLIVPFCSATKRPHPLVLCSLLDMAWQCITCQN